MAAYRLTEAAETDIVEILAWSETQFGGAARRRYERLIVAALIDIATDPIRPGSIARPELGPDVRSWHLRSSRERARDSDGVVQRPRHFLIYRRVDAALIAIGRVLHDSMELERHLQGPGAWD
ncbi:MAG: type II toxin-antitoxin system RelE/ParE family toxin [Phenylobacterium sp.]|uniref:type II toxin-antitoxin system RelE/ParE family toxin n=1 Tax=Phenylobacterium sp. TaxID=1871053 RepID=UPI002736178A|nr:type II toxin-antitoxin system RelE/ParE family toxin [Phenylobacterium sp.]MDP3747810.1 type II toxin-antitoxin system RelE/ParE family toxin [Phenylobacterium sp.]